MDEVKRHFKYDEAKEIARLSMDIKQSYIQLKQEISELKNVRDHLDMDMGSELDLDEFFEDFENYVNLWKFAAEWQYVYIFMHT